MIRLTLGAKACAETLKLLIEMAWADAQLEDEEKEGVRAASKVLNLSKATRDDLEKSLEKAPGLNLDGLEGLSDREQSFAFVTAAWMARIDGDVADTEAELLEKVAKAMSIDGDRREALEGIAQELAPRTKGAPWSSELDTLFKEALKKVDDADGDVEISVE